MKEGLAITIKAICSILLLYSFWFMLVGSWQNVLTADIIGLALIAIFFVKH